MNASPFLVLQMQRMGDLVLSFPLLGWLAATYPGSPLWVVGEQKFFAPLMPLSPNVLYFDYDALPDLRGTTVAGVINISHRREAAALAGSIKTDLRIGPWLDNEGRLYISGDWQLYRASLTHNNRYNLFHWADLNALDCIPESGMLMTHWPLPRTVFPIASGARIGLFLGASEEAKHPDAAFWAALTRRLLSAGHKPVLLGGEAELPLGNAVAAALNAPFLNLCNRFTVSALARFLGELDLLITPDTGPMHIAAWLGTPVLNLSMGPVNPWETGPFSPGHHIIRSTLDCASCWACIHKTYLCHACLRPEAASAAALALLNGDMPPQAPFAPAPRLRQRLGQLEILRTQRGRHGLFHLETGLDPTSPQTAPLVARRRLSVFWKAWFGALFNRFPAQEPENAWDELRIAHPEIATELPQSAGAFALLLARTVRSAPGTLHAQSDFWRKAPPPLQPLSGYLQLYLQNNGAGRQALAHALSLLEQIAALP